MSKDVVKIKRTDRAMDYWAVEKLIDWAAGKNGNETTKAALDRRHQRTRRRARRPDPEPD